MMVQIVERCLIQRNAIFERIIKWITYLLPLK